VHFVGNKAYLCTSVAQKMSLTTGQINVDPSALNCVTRQVAGNMP